MDDVDASTSVVDDGTTDDDVASDAQSLVFGDNGTVAMWWRSAEGAEDWQLWHRIVSVRGAPAEAGGARDGGRVQ